MTNPAPTLSRDADTLWRQDHDHFLHPWAHFDSFAKDGSLVMNQSEGVYVGDVAGKRYLDGIGGLWCVNIGHGREEMADAIAAQARQLAYYNPFVDTTNVPATELAAKLSELAPGDLNHVFYSTGGSTANETAYRMAQFYWSCRGQPDKRHVIAREGAYHGSTYLTMSLGGRIEDRAPEFGYITDTIHHVSCPDPYRRPQEMDEAAFCDHLIEELEQKIRELGADRLAAFFAEPILGAGGVIVPPKGYHRRSWELCRKYDLLYVSDEVVTAFGRLGHMFASLDAFGVQPDIICSAKGLTSGYQPLGATIYSDAIHETISAPGKNRTFTHGFTYSGHPVACAAGLKNIEIMEREDLCGHVREVGPYFEERLNSLRELPIVGDVRGSHLMMCVESVADKATREPFADSLDIGGRVARHAEARGLIVRPLGALNVMSPPLIITKSQIDDLVAILHAALEAVQDKLVSEGAWHG